MLRAASDPTNPVAPAPAPTGDKWIDRITLPEGVSRQELTAWLKTPAGQQWLEASKKTNITTTQGWGPAGSTLHPVAAPGDQIRDWVSRSGWSPLDEPDQPTLMDMGPDYANQWNALWRQFRQQYPTWTRDQLRKAVHQTIMQNMGQGQREFEDRFGPKKPTLPVTPEDQLRQLIGDARQKMDLELKKQREMDKLRMEFGQKRDSQQQDQEVLNSGRKWRWNGTNYVYDDTNDMQAAQDEAKRLQLQDQNNHALKAMQQQQEAHRKKLPPRPAAGTQNSYLPIAKPGQAQPVQPPAQGTRYGEWINDPEGTTRTADWRDSDGDGIDDRYQSGPGQPRALPPGVRPNPIGGKGNLAPIGPRGERWMF